MRLFLVCLNLGFLGFLGFFTAPAQASEFRTREEIGLGFTDNAYLTQENRKSDSYLFLSTSNYITRESNEFGLRLGYTKYSSEKANDFITWRVGDTYSLESWKYSANFVGENYPSGSPGITDVSYNNIGIDLDAEKEEAASSKTRLIYGGGYKLRDYTSFAAGRIDNTAYGEITAEHELSPKLVVSGSANGGPIVSSVPDYSRIIISLEGLVDYSLTSKWLWTSELMITESYFLNRTVSTQVETVGRRGVRTIGTRMEHETYTNLFLSTALLKQQTSQFKWGCEINTTNQSSRSGYEDYAALSLLGRIILVF